MQNVFPLAIQEPRSYHIRLELRAVLLYKKLVSHDGMYRKYLDLFVIADLEYLFKYEMLQQKYYLKIFKKILSGTIDMWF